jgi:predicted PurR-regulated permease PerM
LSNESTGPRTAGIVVIAVIAAVAALYLGAVFLVPIAFAMVLNALFRPVVRGLQKLRLPAPAGAAIVVLGLLAAMVGLAFAAAAPAKAWFAEAPQKLSAAEAKLSRFREPVKQVSDVAAKIDQATSGPASQPSTPSAGEAPPAKPAAAAATSGGVAVKFLGTTTAIVGGIAEVLLLLYLMLAGGGIFLRKLTLVLRRPDHKRVAGEVVHEAEAVVFRYIAVSALINVGQAAVVALAMWGLGLPNPILWGAFTVVLEFVPYLGAAVMMVLLSVAALATFDSVGRILLVPGTYMVITTLQNNVVSPIAYGRRLKLNPVAVLIGVLFWWFVWGVPGAFLAVPIVATIKIYADRVEGLRPLGELLGE